MGLPFHRKLARRIVAPVWRSVRNMAVLLAKPRFSRVEGAKALYQYRKSRGELDRAQWQRWYQVNRKRQRQLTAWKRMGGGPIDPRITGLPRAYVP